jgi:lysophospholipase L1-like esterase
LTRSIKILLLFLIAGIIQSCNPGLEPPIPEPGSADLSKTIAVGGNYMAGYQDGALYRDGQRLSIAALLARQFEHAGGGKFSQHLMPDNSGLGLSSKPWEGAFVTPSRLGDRTDCKGVTSLGPVKSFITLSAAAPYLQAIAGNSFQDFSFPFARVQKYFDPSFGMSYANGNTNPYYHRIASDPGSSTVYIDAKAQNATFLTVWVGMEDIYEYARAGGYNTSIAPAATFSAYLDTLLSGLTANGAKGVIANIPSIKTFPFYTLIDPRGLELTQNKADSLNQLTGGIFNLQAGSNGFIIYDDNAPFDYRQMEAGEYILLTVPTDSMKCNFMGALTEIPDRYVLDASEVQEINGAVNAYNDVIAQKAAQYGLALVDMNAYLETVQSGIKWDGVDFDAEFVGGGFFCLDGYHPNQKGYALITNEFIKAINAKYGSTIPTVNCTECAGILFP